MSFSVSRPGRKLRGTFTNCTVHGALLLENSPRPVSSLPLWLLYFHCSQLQYPDLQEDPNFTGSILT